MQAMIDQFTPLIMKYTHFFAPRAAALASSLDREDIQQELTIIFMRCVRSFDPSKGVKFMTYTIQAFFHDMNRRLDRDQRNWEEGVTYQDTAGEGDDEFSILDGVASEGASPEELMEALSCLEWAFDSLSEEARVLVNALVDPPDAVLQQFQLQIEGAASRRDRLIEGVTLPRSRQQFNLKFLFELFEVPLAPSRHLRAEIESKVAHAFAFAR